MCVSKTRHHQYIHIGNNIPKSTLHQKSCSKINNFMWNENLDLLVETKLLYEKGAVVLKTVKLIFNLFSAAQKIRKGYISQRRYVGMQKSSTTLVALRISVPLAWIRCSLFPNYVFTLNHVTFIIWNLFCKIGVLYFPLLIHYTYSR